MAKYNKQTVKRIQEYIEQDLYSISEICTMMRISRKTFYEWKNTKPEFEEALEDSFTRRDEALVTAARISLKRKVEGYTLTETRTVYEPDKINPSKMNIKSQVVRKKEYAPDTASIKLVLERENKRKEKQQEQREVKRGNILYVTVKTQEEADSWVKFRERVCPSGKTYVNYETTNEPVYSTTPSAKVT